MLEYFYTKFGMLIYTFPAVMILLVGREWYLYNTMSKMGFFVESHYTGKTKNPFLTFDLWAFVVLAVGGASWGGLISKGKKDTLSSFIVAQTWFIIIIIVAFIFLQTKDLNKSKYMYIFLIEIIKKSWVLHWMNYIPLPPFDASFFYAQKAKFTSVGFVSKVLASALIIFIPITNDFLSGMSLLKFLGIN